MKTIFIVRPFDRELGIMTPSMVFASAEAVLNYYEKQGVVTDEFERTSGHDAVKDYLESGGSSLIIKVTPEKSEGELFELIGLTAGKPSYYHVSEQEIHD